MKKIIILLLLYSTVGFGQIVPCVANQMKKYNNKVDSVFLNATADSIIVIDSFFKRTAIAIGAKTFIEKNRFHVDPNGSDANIGSDESPVLTIAKGLTLLGTGDILVVGEGVYPETLTMNVQNTGLSGETALYGSLSQISTLNVTTASGTSNKISDITIATLNHTGGAPLYLTNSSVSGALTKNNSAYIEIRNSSLQGSTNNFTGGSGLISNSLIGNTIINSGGYTIKDVVIDPLDSLVIKSGVVYNIQNVTGKVVIEAGAIPMSTALQAQGVSAEYSKAYETDYANKLAMINPDSVATSANVVTWNRTTKRLEYTKMPPSIDTTSLSNRINLKVSYTDTASMLAPYLRKVDTASLSNRIDKKVDSVWYKSDTMFVKTKTGTIAYAQTKYVDTIYRNTNGDSIIWQKNGTTYKFSIASKSFNCGVVFFNGTNPTSATIFDTANPPVNNQNSLKNKDCALYIGTDESVWSSDGTSYSTYIAPNATEWVLSGTNIDAGADKIANIGRTGWIGVGKTTPNHAVDVVSNIAVRNVSGNGGTNYGIEFNTNANAPRVDFVFNGSYVGQFGSDANDFYYRNSRPNTGTHLWSTSQGAGQVSQMRLRNDGLLWIRNTPTITNATSVLVPDPTTNDVKAQLISNIKNTEWYTAGTTTDAGGDKSGSIYRNGNVLIATQGSTQQFGQKDFHLQAGGNSLLTGAFGGGMIFSTNNGAGTRFFLEHTTSAVNEKTSIIYNQGGLTYLGATVTDNGGAWVFPAPLVVKHSNGFVGFNQTNPAYSADINGTARIVITPTIATATKALVKNPTTGQISEQNLGGLWERDIFTATASQTTFTLAKTPVGNTEKVHFTRNGVDISHAVTVAGNVVTYVPASNGSKVMNAGDRIIIHYEAY